MITELVHRLPNWYTCVTELVYGCYRIGTICITELVVFRFLTDQPTHPGARNYWKVMKPRVIKEGNETVTSCNCLKMLAEDDKMRLTDIADTEQLFRLQQPVRSKKVGRFKL